MTNFGNNEWIVEVAKGNVPGHRLVHKFGKNPTVGTGAIEDIWYNSGLYTWPTVASTLEAISTSAADTAAGAGARTITVQGLDINGVEISEDITMNGLAASIATTASFFRVNRAFVATSGTYATGITGSHTGTITIRISGAGATQCVLGIENGLSLGQTQVARYSVPTGKTGYLLSYEIIVASNKDAEVYFQRRDGADTVAAPFSARRVNLAPAFISGPFGANPIGGIGGFTGISDVWWSGISSVGGGGADISVDFAILLVDDGF